MTLRNFKVQYFDIAVGFVALTNVQNVSVNVGRQEQLDAYNTATATVEIRYPNGFATPIPQLVAGAAIKITDTNDANEDIFFGYIRDVQVQYGIPYQGSIGNADRLTLYLEGAFAAAGRMQGNNYAMPAGTATAQLQNMANQSGVGSAWVGPTNPLFGATTVSGTWGDWLNRFILTTNSRLIDGTSQLVITSQYSHAVKTVGFSDVSNNATNQVYDSIEFHSLADNYYTQVTVAGEGLAEQTATKAGATIPYRTYKVNTFNASTSQASDYANYLLGNYGTSRFAIASVSCLAEAQNSFQLNDLGDVTILPGSPSLPSLVGSQVSVTFRGTVFPCIIEGVRLTGSYQSSRYTYYLSGADLNAYLTLNDSVFGRLDFNKLGY